MSTERRMMDGRSVGVLLLMSAGLIVVSRFSYLLFHTLAELFAIFISLMIFVFSWHTRHRQDDSFFPFLGMAYLHIGFLDLVHAFTYRGMTIMPWFSGANFTSQVWVGTRLIEALALVLAPLYFARKASLARWGAIWSGLSALLLLSIFYWRIMPDTIVDGVGGLTQFKIVLEYGICALLGGAIAHLHRRRSSLAPGICRLLTISIALTILAELCFTLYRDIYGIFNLVGHVFKIFSFFLIYKAVIETGIRQPFEVIYRSLKRHESELEKLVTERSVELRASEEKFRFLAEHSPSVVFMADLEGKGVYASDEGWRRFTGLPSGSWAGDGWVAPVHAEDRERVLAGWRRTVREKVPWREAFRWCHQDGGYRWIQGEAFLRLDQDSKPVGFIGICTDITPIKRSEEEKREQLEELRLATATADVGIWKFSPTDERLDWNEQAHGIYGIPAEQFDHQLDTWRQTVHPEDLPGADAWFAEISERGEVNGVEFRIVRPDGQIRYILASGKLIKNAAGQPVSMIGVNLDVTSTKDREKALRSSEMMFRATFEQAAVGIAHVGLDGRFLRSNERFCSITGYSPEEMVRLTFQDITPEEDLELDMAHVSDLLAGSVKRYSMEKRYRRKDGELTWVRLTVSLLRDEQARPEYFISVVEDIQEIKQAEARLRQSEELLHQSLAGAKAGAWQWEFATDKVVWTPENYELLGYAPDNPGNPHDLWRDRLVPDQLKRIGQKIESWRDRGGLLELEYEVRSDGGEVRVFSTLGRSVNDHLGEPVRAYGINIDITDRRLSEASVNRYEHIVSATPDMMAFVDDNYVYQAANESYCRAFGKQRSDLIGKSVLEVFGQEFFTEVILPHAKRCLQGEVVHYEDWFEFPATGRRYMTVTYYPYRGAEDRVDGFVVDARDLTANRIAAKQLRLTQTSIDAAAIAIFWTRPDGSIAYANRRASESLGYSLEELLRFGVADVDSQASPDEAVEVFRQIRKTGTVQFRTSHQRRDGTIFPVEVIATYVSFEDDEYAFVFAEDLTQRQSMEKALELSELRFRTLFEEAPIGIDVVSLDGRPLLANRALQQFLGYSEKELLGFHMKDYTHPDDVLATEELLARIRAGEKTVERLEKRYLAKSGEVRWGQISVARAEMEGEENPLVIAMVEDITPRKEAQRKLEELNANLELEVEERTADLKAAKERAESADRLKSLFLATMSHELRTPLNSIIGFSSILLEGLPGPLNPEQNKQMGMIHGRAEHLLDLINDILDLSRIEAGRLELHPAEFDLAVLLREWIATFEPAAEEKQLQLDYRAGCDSLLVTADSRRVQQIILNLVGNAFKFTEQGGVTIELRFPLEDGPNDFWEVKVRDTGPGIAADQQERIFSAFVQAHDKRRKREPGSGLGLNISRDLARLMGGEVTCESTPGAGSCFALRLPMRVAKTAEPDG